MRFVFYVFKRTLLGCYTEVVQRSAEPLSVLVHWLVIGVDVI